MKELYSVTRTVTFSVMAENMKDAEVLAADACPIDDAPARANVDTRAMRTLNQSEDLKRLAVNYE
jgi:hypothetical protein